MQPNFKKRRTPHGPSKNELRAARRENAEAQKSQTGTLRQRYPQVEKLELAWRFETITGATLEDVSRNVSLDEPLQLDIPCPAACGGGHFLLTDAVENLLAAAGDYRDGMATCQAASYADPRVPCGVKLFFKIKAQIRG